MVAIRRCRIAGLQELLAGGGGNGGAVGACEGVFGGGHLRRLRHVAARPGEAGGGGGCRGAAPHRHRRGGGRGGGEVGGEGSGVGGSEMPLTCFQGAQVAAISAMEAAVID